MKVFLAGTSLLPSYGGPAFSVSRLAIALTEAGIEVGLWAPDQSAATTPLLGSNFPVQRLMGSAKEALNTFGTPDVLHDNGIWLRHNHRLAEIASERRIPRIVSTRGMLNPWELQHKRWKKRLAWWLYQHRDLKRARCHHATGRSEASNVQSLGLGVPVCVVPNGIDVPVDHKPQVGGVNDRRIKTALFLSRIHPKKGLPMLVEAWARMRPTGWRLEIFGPDEAGHRSEVEAAVRAAGLSGVISFMGPADGTAKQSAFRNADLFILPTHSENFGMVIAEALAHGLPVLTTTAAPWPMLPERGCGWSVDATVDGIAHGLGRATSLESATLQAMGAKGREFVEAEFAWKRIAKEFVALYEEVKRI